MEFLVKPLEIDLDRLLISFEILMHDSASLGKLEKVFEKHLIQKIFLQSLRKQTEDKISWQQHKKWYALIRTILRHQVEKFPELNLVITDVVVDAFHDQLKKQYYPVRLESFGDFVLPKIPSITELTKEEGQRVISKVIETYTDLGVSFESWKSEYLFEDGQAH